MSYELSSYEESTCNSPYILYFSYFIWVKYLYVLDKPFVGFCIETLLQICCLSLPYTVPLDKQNFDANVIEFVIASFMPIYLFYGWLGEAYFRKYFSVWILSKYSNIFPLAFCSLVHVTLENTRDKVWSFSQEKPSGKDHSGVGHCSSDFSPKALLIKLQEAYRGPYLSSLACHME